VTIAVGALLALLAAAEATTFARAGVESWSDPSLGVRRGLVLWIDVGRQAAARAARGLPGSAPGSATEIVVDGSGARHHLVQRRAESQPRLVSASGRSVLRFDGKDDCLEAAGLDLKLDGLTIFLVAAPRSNLGGFRGLLSGNQAGVNDYASGFTVDLGPAATVRFDTLNVEGKGFAGAVNVLKEPHPFGEFRLIQVVIPPGGEVRSHLDGTEQIPRPRRAGTMAIDEVTMGARCYSNEPRPVHVQGFFHGDLAEALVYDRALDDADRKAVAAYLANKHQGLSEAIGDEADAPGTRRLKTVDDPPPVQMLVPGFMVRRLPLDLSNLNNVRYRPDGKVLALAYNGDVYLLSDRDGDGLEDHAEVFWENKGRIRGPIGMALTPPGYPRGNGLFVASKGKCSLIVDTDGDDRADREIIVADGWRELPVAVDALGVAIGSDGSIYFGLGTGDFTNAYRVDAQGKAHYDLTAERGCIIRVAPDFRTREIIATGIRFPVGMAINRHGDLFATDQEGATWLPNGNPFDELLHIRRGRHYGFPPRHSRHLPGVIDEPSTFDYAPQHQSTCGLLFNDASAEGRAFGPSWWAGNALVCGYSRGKLFRTELVKTRGDYVARTTLLAILSKLTIDACLAPDGSLLVATHSGAPDWGTGPSGPGTLYKITWTGREDPQPVAAWSSGRREMRVAFDRALDPEKIRDLSKRASIEFGPAVAAGDRFETLRPGYAVVAAQLAQPRRVLPVHGATVSPDLRTLILATGLLAEPATYALTLPDVGSSRPADANRGALVQSPETDLAFDLSGCEADWRSSTGSETRSAWLPHLDLAVARELTARISEHEAFWSCVRRPGTLVLRARLRLANLLRPEIQPGSVVDDRMPPETAFVAFRAHGKLGLAVSDAPPGVLAKAEGSNGAVLTVPTRSAPVVPVTITMETGPDAALDVDYHTAEDPRPRALPLRRMLVPWARAEVEGKREIAPEVASRPPGGDWRRGREIFHGEEARCGKCHTFRGRGGRIGPDLSNLHERDLDSVVRDITQPSVAINPDYITYALALSDGRTLNGPVRTENDRLRIGNDKGEEMVVPRSQVEEMKPQPVSIMPEGLPKLLGPGRMDDLLAFLLTPPLAPAAIHRDGAPPGRKAAEVEAVLRAGKRQRPPARPTGGVRPLRIVLVSGAKDHGVDEHDYPLWSERWAALLRLAVGVTVTTAVDWPSADELARADVMVWYSANARWSATRARELDAFLSRGGGLAVIHFALNGTKAPDDLARLIGRSWIDGRSKFRHGPLDVVFPQGTRHPITAGFERLHLQDESYWNLTPGASRVDDLAAGDEEGKPQPLFWTVEHARGRAFCSVPGHYTWTFDDPLFRILLLRGICWTAREDVDRLSELATVGARVDGGAQ
jgi:putative heme-binding domain-containing protein